MNPQQKTKKHVVLIVEDDHDIREYLSSKLRSLFNIIIIEACCGEDAIVLFEKNKIDLLITDFNMPRGNGLWLLNEISKIKLSQFIIVLTSEPCLELDILTQIHTENTIIDKMNLRALYQKISSLGFP